MLAHWRMSYPRASIVAVALSGVGLGCSASVPPPPVRVAPTPRTVTVQHPGGDATDPEEAALQRLLAQRWGVRRDRTNTLLVPLPDATHWTRVRLWGYPTRAAFRFGDEHYGIVALWYGPSDGKDDPSSCLDHFLEEARPAAEAYGTRVLATHREAVLPRPLEELGTSGPVPRADAVPPRPGSVVVQVVDAVVDGLFSSHGYAGALASYPSWPGTCLIQGFVAAAGDHPELAARIRDRWVTEGAPRLSWHPRVAAPPGFDDR
jgi:hypothetical protein